MWISSVDFDGTHVSGVLQNAPNTVRSVKEGDKVRVPLESISDWMFVLEGKAYGAFTVNLFRSRMSQSERTAHDYAWGLDFGDPESARLPTYSEHPASLSLAESFPEALAKGGVKVNEADAAGWTLLHRHSLAGNLSMVDVLLSNGADKNVKLTNGQTSIDLARKMGWELVVDRLERTED